MLRSLKLNNLSYKAFTFDLSTDIIFRNFKYNVQNVVEIEQ